MRSQAALDRRKKKLKAYIRVWQATKNRQIINEARNKPCTDCHRIYPLCCMEFDHARGTKLSNIARLGSKRVSQKALLIEIVKCDIVCANCHRIRTFERLEVDQWR